MKKKVFIALRMAGIAGQYKLAGIFRYLSERYGEKHPWDIELVRTRSEVTGEFVADALKRGANGFIVSIPGIESELKLMAEKPIPVILLDMTIDSFENRKSNLTVIRTSADKIGREAALYLMRQGISRSYAFLHAKGVPYWSKGRFNGFRDTLSENGHWCTEIHSAKEMPRLKKGTAIFVANDDTAYKLIDILKARKYKIPKDFAVLGVDNDTLICENCHPKLSSVLPDFEAEGFLAAESLDKMMCSSKPTPANSLYVGVKRIVHRQSTLEPSPQGKLVQKAIAFIDTHALEGIDVRDVTNHLGCSRRLADLRFREFQGRSILETIVEKRLAAVRQRLTETRDKIDVIAGECGFKNSNYLKNLFKKRYSMTMSEFRRAGSSLKASRQG